MANGGTIEIDVELTGTQDIKSGLTSIGEAGKSLAVGMGSTNDKLGEGLDSLGESVFGLVDSFAGLKEGVQGVGSAGVMGFTSLLGPIAMVVTAGMAAFETFKMLSGAAMEAEQNEAAMAAAASDLQSKLEALAEKGVIPSTKELEQFTLQTIKAQFAKEKMQGAEEKLTKIVAKAYKAEQEREEALKNFIETKKEGLGVDFLVQAAQEQYIKSLQKEKEATKALSDEVKKHLRQQRLLEEQIKAAAKVEEELEERSAESMKAKIKEQLQKRKILKLAQAEAKMKEDEFKKKKIEIELEEHLGLLKVERNEENAKELAKQKKNLKAELDGFKKVEIAQNLANHNLKKLDKERANKAKQEQQRAKSMRQQRDALEKARLQKEKQADLKRITEGARIRQLQLQAEEDSTLKQIQLARHRFDTAKKLAGANENQQLIARLSFENEVTAINRQAEQQRLQEKKQIEEQRRAFALESLNFDIQQIEDQTQRELLMLQVKHDEELRLAQDNEEQKQELQRRFSIQFLKTLNRETDEMKQKFKDMFADMGRGFAEAAVGAMLMGESFKDSTALVLQGLAKQAGVESLMETAKGIAALFINPAGASNHFAAAGAFGAAAVAAGAASSALGGGGGGSFGGGGGMSPSGSPQTSSMMQREEATSSSMVFNVNFSGAVVYDTKRAAEQALADRVARVMKKNRRGAPRS